jgi:hypothetical protein
VARGKKPVAIANPKRAERNLFTTEQQEFTFIVVKGEKGEK